MSGSSVSGPMSRRCGISARWLLILILVLMVQATVLGYAQTQQMGKRVALIFGNASYTKLGKLRNPTNDARDIGSSLERLGFDVEVVVDGDLGAMMEAVERFGKRLTGAEAGLFFYAGHGVQASGVNYLIPIDADVQGEYQLKYRTLPTDFILETMNASGCGLNIIILDACRDNPFSTFRSTARGLAVVGSAPSGAIIVYATDPGKTAADGTGNHGTFTEALLKHISTPGLDVKELFDRVGSDVATVTKQQQTPWVSSKYYGSYFLAGMAQPPKPALAAAPQSATTPAQTANVKLGKAELIVRTIPEGADVLIDGTSIGAAGDVLTISAGAEIEVMAKNGFLVGSTKLVPASGQLYELDIKLVQQKGNLLVKALGAETGIMYLDGKEVGTFGKGLFRDLPAGDHEYTIRGKGFYAVGKVSITPDLTTTVPVTLSEVGLLRLSMPDDCEVKVSAKGYGPVTVGSKQLLEDLPVGEISVSARGSGYDDVDARLSVRKGVETLWTPWTVGGLTIETSPAGAIVTMNGKSLGQAPQLVRGLLPGKATVGAKADGYEDSNVTAAVLLGKISKVLVRLTRSTGSFKPLVADDVHVSIEGDESGRQEGVGSMVIQGLPTGIYRVDATGPGYEPSSTTITVRRNEEATWKPWLTGALYVDCDPSGAFVTVGGTEVGRSPVKSILLPVASTLVVAKADGYEDASMTISVVGGKTTPVPIKLSRSMGYLKADMPADAFIMVRSGEIGERKVAGASTCQLPTGEYLAEAGGSGYESVSSVLTVRRNAETVWTAWKTGTILVTSDPPGARIWIGDKAVGTEPATLAALPVAPISVIAKAQGYEDASRLVSVIGGKTTSVSMKLQRSVGRLKVDMAGDATVLVSSDEIGTQRAVGSAASFTLPIGEYRVLAERQGYDPDSALVTVGRNIDTLWTPWKTGSLRVESDPPGATIYLGNKEAGRAPTVISALPIASTSVVVKAKGYEDASAFVTVVRGKTTVVPIKMARSVGHFEANIPEDVTITVRSLEIGERKAVGSFASFVLPTGEYEAKAERPGFESVVAPVKIERNANYIWTPWTKGYLSFTSIPPGATVLVDGSELGVTPVLVEVEAQKTHRIQLNLAKYESYSSEINVPVGKKMEVARELHALPGSIRVETAPSGATVVIDNHFGTWKTTPCVFENIEAGQHTVDSFLFNKDNKIYSIFTYTVNVGAAENVIVTKQLARDAVVLKVDALPGSELYLDGKLVQDSAVFSEGITMLAGQYEALLKGPEGQEWRITTVFPGGSTLLSSGNMGYTVPQRTITVDGKLDDWIGIGPVFFASGDYDPFPKNAGTKISKGYMCMDDKSLYWRMDLADGKPDAKLWNQVYELNLSTIYNGVSLSLRNIWGKLVAYIGTNQKAPDEGFYAGSYALTPVGLEVSFPISSFKKYSIGGFSSAYMRIYVNHGTDFNASRQTEDSSLSQLFNLVF